MFSCHSVFGRYVWIHMAVLGRVRVQDEINGLLDAIETGEEMRVEGWAAMSPKWATLIMLMSESLMDQGGGW